MADLPFPWRVYAQYQDKAARCAQISDWSWGIEDGLAHFLTAVESNGVPKNQEEFQRSVDVATATGSWVERNHARLRRKYLRPEQEPHAEPRALARVRLAEIREAVSAAEWALLIAAAAGVACHEIATRSDVTAGSIRTRLARLRARLRSALIDTVRVAG